MNKYEDFSWDFINENTKRETHCFHNYPAMMIPQIADKLIDKYGKGANLLFDPYCGTGTSLIEANKNNISAIGTDLNPLARLIATTKTTKIDEEIVDKHILEFEEFLGNSDKATFEIPMFFNIHYWFTDEVLRDLAIIKKYIDNLKNNRVRNFFNVAFSETVREASLTRNSEFKLYRMSQKQMENFNPNTKEMFIKKVKRNLSGLSDYQINLGDKVFSKVSDFNTVDGIPKEMIESVDIVITSPPYGDSKTTVAYGQFSRLSNQWLGIVEASKVDNNLMGGKKKKEINKFKFEKIDKIIDEIWSIDKKRAYEVYSFYSDYFNSIKNVSKSLKKNGIACYVVGNRTVKGINLPTDEITKHFFEINGFKHLETIIRNIPNKRMPSKNSPTNVKGMKTSTMLFEYIVIMSKIKSICL